MEDIVLKIEKSIWNSYNNENRIGLYSGLSGIIMFYDYICEIYPLEEYENKLLVIIEKANELIENQESMTSLCHGMAGYGLILLRLKNKNIEISEEYFENIDTYLLNDFDSLCTCNEYDFMHGAMGIAMYFIERYKLGNNEDHVASVLNVFGEKLIFKINTDFKKVLIKSDETKSDYYTFGMAHGVAGYLNFLVYFKKHFESLDITASLKICVDFLTFYKNFDVKSKQHYPNVFMLDSQKNLSSRLSWCQGDLGISNAFYNTGVYLEDKDLINEAVILMNHSAALSLEDSGVKDFGICHGSAGVLIQFYLASKKYNIDYSKEIKYWLDALEKQTNNFEKFLSYDKNSNQYDAETNMLFGSAGLGLVLLTIENRIDSKWLEIFNLY
jgi:hypothetical protein